MSILSPDKFPPLNRFRFSYDDDIPVELHMELAVAVLVSILDAIICEDALLSEERGTINLMSPYYVNYHKKVGDSTTLVFRIKKDSEYALL